MSMKNIFKKMLCFVMAVAVSLSMLYVTDFDSAIEAEAATNLLTNPGGETGDLTGWVDSSSEKCWEMGYDGTINGWSHPAARTGSYYFITGWPSDSESPRYLYQDVNIKSYRGKLLTYSAYIGGYGQSDGAGIRLDILNSSGKVLKTITSKMYTNVSYGSWTTHPSVKLVIPSSAYTARAYLVGVLHEGGETDAYFDDMSLTVSSLSKVKSLKVTNKKGRKIYVSYKKVSGASGYQIAVASKKSMSGAKKYNTTAKKTYIKSGGKAIKYKKGKTYYVRVRAYKKDSKGTKIYGSWTSVKKVKIKK
ncbi:MAG: hypothetical protein K6E13_05025 [Lachnospiraceae bacterium]|nr:hypothetical protein [Lachnospiraceae bacterium]